MQNKKGISGVLAAVVMIALVMVAGTIVWTVVNNMVKEKLEGSGSCINVFEKVSLNLAYTCFDDTQIPPEVIFSISRRDIDIDVIVVFITGGGSTKNFRFDETGVDSSEIIEYSIDAGTSMPGKNEGKTYKYTGDAFPAIPDSIEIAPVIGEKQCGVSDEITEIPTCSELGL